VKTKPATCSPLIFNVYKPTGVSSQKVVAHFKKNLPDGFGKIGHMGTLDPFAEGILPIAIAGAARLNNLFHENFEKKYIAHGVLGLETPTGDCESEFSQKDSSDYLKAVISQFSLEFLQETLEKKFIGDYWQSPHKYSAAKFEGKPLHQWAREGVDIKKEKVLRKVLSLKVLEFNFPKLVIEFEVSSGTYIRSLFSECAQELGTIGYLDKLVRSNIGPLSIEESISEKEWPWERKDYFSNGSKLTDLFSYTQLDVNESQKNDLHMGRDIEVLGLNELIWCLFDSKVLCLAERMNNVVKVKINFPQMY